MLLVTCIKIGNSRQYSVAAVWTMEIKRTNSVAFGGLLSHTVSVGILFWGPSTLPVSLFVVGLQVSVLPVICFSAAHMIHCVEDVGHVHTTLIWDLAQEGDAFLALRTGVACVFGRIGKNCPDFVASVPM